MKAVAAMYLFQPHRAARDFRGIRAEFDSSIFQPYHDVVPYHLACYANYKFAFFIRNKRIHRTAKIYKYYILFALGFIYCDGKNIFSMKRSTQKTVCDGLQSLIADEGEFVMLCDNMAYLLDEIVFNKFADSQTPREKLRDMLRTETFAKDFRERLLAERRQA